MSVNFHVPVTGFMQGYPALHPEGVNANPLPADLSGIPAGMTDQSAPAVLPPLMPRLPGLQV